MTNPIFLPTLLTIPYPLSTVFRWPDDPSGAAEIRGQGHHWNQAVLPLWLAIFLFSGRTSVTGQTLS